MNLQVVVPGWPWPKPGLTIDRSTYFFLSSSTTPSLLPLILSSQGEIRVLAHLYKKSQNLIPGKTQDETWQ